MKEGELQSSRIEEFTGRGVILPPSRISAQVEEYFQRQPGGRELMGKCAVEVKGGYPVVGSSFQEGEGGHPDLQSAIPDHDLLAGQAGEFIPTIKIIAVGIIFIAADPRELGLIAVDIIQGALTPDITEFSGEDAHVHASAF